MNFDFLDDILWKPIGKSGAEADTFMKREMPFDSGWGAPAAAVAAYFGGPMAWEAMGQGAAGAGGAAEGGSVLGGGELLGGSDVLGGGGMTDYVSSLFGGETGGAFAPGEWDMAGSFNLPGSTLKSTDIDALNQLALDNGVSQGEPSWLDNLMGNNEQGLYDKFNATNPNGTPKNSFSQQLGKQLMQNKPGSQMGQNMPQGYNEPPVQRQSNTFQFAPAAPIQSEKSDLSKLVALLRKKDKE